MMMHIEGNTRAKTIVSSLVLATIVGFHFSPWRTPVDVSFIVATNAARERGAVMHRFVKIALP
jgi:hypothetical protein